MDKLRQALHALSHIFLRQKHTRYIKVVTQGKRVRYKPFELPAESVREGRYYTKPQMETIEERVDFLYEATKCDICGRIDLVKNMSDI